MKRAQVCMLASVLHDYRLSRHWCVCAHKLGRADGLRTDRWAQFTKWADPDPKIADYSVVSSETPNRAASPPPAERW